MHFEWLDALTTMPLNNPKRTLSNESKHYFILCVLLNIDEYR